MYRGSLNQSCLCSLSQVDRQSQFIQGYRVLYRQTSGLPSPGHWQTQDVKVPSERSVVLSSLKKGIMYEIKVRPYFNEFQGMDSESRMARTTEEGTKRKSFCRLCQDATTVVMIADTCPPRLLHVGMATPPLIPIT